MRIAMSRFGRLIAAAFAAVVLAFTGVGVGTAAADSHWDHDDSGYSRHDDRHDDHHDDDNGHHGGNGHDDHDDHDDNGHGGDNGRH
ncbi:hypothetical protein ACIHCQ_21235 [Streptomyces sp. NPDC052236]|uniref:hypothetical protein n=1 Tax=Streptomyces sp. NPDC052236 TaxID=3365686 RepID=UPI0037CFD7A2